MGESDGRSAEDRTVKQHPVIEDDPRARAFPCRLITKPITRPSRVVKLLITQPSLGGIRRAPLLNTPPGQRRHYPADAGAVTTLPVLSPLTGPPHAGPAPIRATGFTTELKSAI